jgi:hypothetical protein
MTPKEKVYELMFKYYVLDAHDEDNFIIRKERAKQCTLIAIDEVIKSREDDSRFDDTLSSTGSEYYTPHPMYLTYWLQVKQEIEKL